ncbi:ABC transporter substrate-binding protein [Lacrimispora sp. AGF001]|uniref:ABC transporter substrate-binding protein n=1 Tax=Lacrimispora sp. AGF001 TaxID=3401631 RepID=UPI003B43034B
MSKYKRRSILAAAALSAILLTACGAANKEAATDAGSKVTEQAEETTAGKDTRVIKMEYGDVEIPANPKRVVVAFFQGDLLALGIHPVGTSFNDDAVFEQELGDVTVVDAFELNPEAIMELDPDLIIWNNTDDYESLSKIAPTLARNYYDMEVKDRLAFFGEVFGVPEKAEKIMTDFEKKAEESKKQLSEKGLADKNVILLENQTKGILRAFGDDYGRGGEIIYQYLGLKAPERIQKEVMDQEGVNFIDISYETLKDYVGDYIFSDERIADLKGVEVWESLPAVREGRLVQNSSGMFWFSDITSMNAQMDFIMDSLLKTVEGQSR